MLKSNYEINLIYDHNNISYCVQPRLTILKHTPAFHYFHKLLAKIGQAFRKTELGLVNPLRPSVLLKGRWAKISILK